MPIRCQISATLPGSSERVKGVFRHAVRGQGVGITALEHADGAELAFPHGHAPRASRFSSRSIASSYAAAASSSRPRSRRQSPRSVIAMAAIRSASRIPAAASFSKRCWAAASGSKAASAAPPLFRTRPSSQCAMGDVVGGLGVGRLAGVQAVRQQRLGGGEGGPEVARCRAAVRSSGWRP